MLLESSFFSTLPASLQRCGTFFEKYLSCFHPKIVTVKNIIRCHKAWTRLHNLITETLTDIPVTDGDVNNENDWLYRRRNDYRDEEAVLTEFIDSLHNQIQSKYQSIYQSKSSSRNNSFQPIFNSDTNHDNPPLNDSTLLTLFRPPQELSLIVMLRKQVDLTSKEISTYIIN